MLTSGALSDSVPIYTVDYSPVTLLTIPIYTVDDSVPIYTVVKFTLLTIYTVDHDCIAIGLLLSLHSCSKIDMHIRLFRFETMCGEKLAYKNVCSY